MKKIILIVSIIALFGKIFSQTDTAQTKNHSDYTAQKTGTVTKGGKTAQPVSDADKLRAGTTVTAVLIGNDTVPVVNLPVFNLFDVRNFKNKDDEKKYYRLKRDVMKVYPYAKLAGEKLRLYNDTLAKIPTEKMRKKFLKQVEKELKDEFTDDLENMSYNQGRILIRLIDRETGNTSYHLLEELRGTFSAFFWQSIARLFGHNLKTRYNPKEGEDKTIEEIVLLIDEGVYK